MRAMVLAFGVAIWGVQSHSMEIRECATISEDLDRLSCYDKAVGLTPKVEEFTTSGSWSLSKKKSEFKDTTDVFLSVETEEPLTCGMFDKSRAVLLLRCMENTTSAMLITSCHLASGFQGYGDIEYRVDEKPSRKKSFEASTDNTSLGLWSGGSAIPFIKELLGGKEIIMRFTPFSESPTTAKFDISGLDKNISALSDACGW